MLEPTVVCGAGADGASVSAGGLGAEGSASGWLSLDAASDDGFGVVSSGVSGRASVLCTGKTGDDWDDWDGWDGWNAPDDSSWCLLVRGLSLR